MPTRNARASWEGSVQKGAGKISLASGSCEPSYSFGSRFESGRGTNPEELLAAAHAGCFSMALAQALAQAGKLRVDNTSKDLKDTALIRKTRRDIARIKQTIAEKKAASAAGQAKA